MAITYASPPSLFADPLASSPTTPRWLQCRLQKLHSPTMVVLLDLDDEPTAEHAPSNASIRITKPVHHSLAPRPAQETRDERVDKIRPNPNVNGFSACLSCYP
jgi:hypothetical protein